MSFGPEVLALGLERRTDPSDDAGMSLGRLLAGALAMALLSCEANLEEGCRDGECASGPPTTDTSSSSGAGGTGGSEPFVCEKPDTFGLPCDVYTVLSDICQNCHFEGTVIAPFKLETFDDTQQDYFGTLIWERMQRATADTMPPPVPAMPQGSHPLPKPKLDALTAWFATCEAGACATGEGIGAGGAGGAGAGAGGAGSGAGGAGGI